MREYETFPATNSNQITKEYYFHLVGEINRGASSHKVKKVLRKNGSYEYETYHLITTM